VHDLKHTFGRRLRTAGVSLETRKVLLGHKTGEITSHYSAPELAELIRAANAILKTQESTLLRVVAQQPKKVANGVKNRAKVAQRRQEKGSHRCKPLIIWRARQDLNPRPPGS